MNERTNGDRPNNDTILPDSAPQEVKTLLRYKYHVWEGLLTYFSIKMLTSERETELIGP